MTCLRYLTFFFPLFLSLHLSASSETEEVETKPDTKLSQACKATLPIKAKSYNVIDLEGVTKTFNFPVESTIAQIKEIIAKELGDTSGQFLRIIFCGEELDDEKTLEDYQAQEETTLHLIQDKPVHPPKNILVMGATQVGKSTLLCSLLGGSPEDFPIGGGDGYSVTLTPLFYEGNLAPYTAPIKVLDTPGLFSTRLETSHEIIHMVEQSVLRFFDNHEQIHGILLVESLASPAQTIQQTLNKLIAAFGDDILKSVIVVGTHQELSKLTKPGREAAVKKYCDSKEIPFVIYEAVKDFRTKEIVPDRKGLRRLLTMLNSSELQMFSSLSLKAKRAEIILRAKKLQAEAQPEIFERTVTVPSFKKVERRKPKRPEKRSDCFGFCTSREKEYETQKVEYDLVEGTVEHTISFEQALPFDYFLQKAKEEFLNTSRRRLQRAL